MVSSNCEQMFTVEIFQLSVNLSYQGNAYEANILGEVGDVWMVRAI